MDTTTPQPAPTTTTSPPVAHPVEAAPAPETPGREGVFKLRASDFQSNEVPHYFLTAGTQPHSPITNQEFLSWFHCNFSLGIILFY